MTAQEVIREVESLGGHLVVDGDGLRVRAPSALPDDVLDAIRAEKPAIMVALGAPFDRAVASILADLRPHLSPALRHLPDDCLLALVNWNIMAAWGKAIRKVH